MKAWVLTVAVLLSLAPMARAQDDSLRYKWAEGLGASYTLAFTSSGKMTARNETRAWKAAWTAEVNVSIESANAQGVADVRFKLGPMKGKQTVVGKGDTTFDIDPEAAKAVVTQDGGDPMTLELTDDAKRALAAGFTATMDDRGNVMSMEGNEQIDLFMMGLQSMAGLPDMIGIVKVMFPILPDQPMAEGGKWEQVSSFPMLREKLGVKVKFAWKRLEDAEVGGKSCVRLGMSAKVANRAEKIAAAANGGMAVEYSGLSMNADGTLALSEVDTLPVAAKYSMTQPGKMTLHAVGTEKGLGGEQNVDETMAMEGCASTAEVTRQ